jgi:hypothetical protein
MKVSVVLVILIFLNTSMMVLAQETELLRGVAIQNARKNAEEDHRGAAWYMIGCVLPVIGVAISNASTPTIPPSRLLGKSPEYINIYTDIYMRRRKQLQFGSALSGCLSTGLFVGCLLVSLRR